MTPAVTHSMLTCEHAPPIGGNTHNERRPPGAIGLPTNIADADADTDTEADAFDVWPRANQRLAYHPFYDCRRIAAQYEADQEKARDSFFPRSINCSAPNATTRAPLPFTNSTELSSAR